MVSQSASKVYRPHTVTFDCWSTLIYEAGSRSALEARARTFAGLVSAEYQATVTALSAAWRQHQAAWHRREVFGARDMVELTLQMLGLESPPDRVETLVIALESEVLSRNILPLPGARTTLQTIADRGVRLALICDTGFSSGRVVRQLLDRHGLLELLEVTVFSDELGVPKPHPRAFARALSGLGVEAAGAVHVGDLRRSDIAGARGFGMGSIRLTAHHDDAGEGAGAAAGVADCETAGCNPLCPRPEADVVAASYAELLLALGYA